MTEAINKEQLRERILELEGLSEEEKLQLVRLLDKDKKYGLVWEDKPEEIEEKMREQLPVLKEIKERAITDGGEDASNHVLIEGDNLAALTALSYTHEGKIDVIYIDPPYNTGNKDFVYNDSFVDTEDGYRHSKWLSFMDKRLRIAKRLLSDKGVIFISIDDNEQANLKLLCDEVFGYEAYVACIAWQRTYSTRNDSKGIPKEVESLMVYSKQSLWTPKKLPRTEKMNSLYKSPDGDPKPWTSSSVSAPGAATHQGMVYAIQHPFTGEMMYPTIGRCWSLGQEYMLEHLSKWGKYELKDINDEEKRAEVCGVPTSEIKKNIYAIVLVKPIEEARIVAAEILNNGNWPYFYFTNGGKGGLRRKTYLDDMDGRVVTNFFSYEECGHTDEAKKELISIFCGKSPFDTPKPTRLLKRIEQISSDSDSIILDFFAGSGTTLHATMQLNAEDGGHRQCILVTNNENNICEEVTYERNKRVIQGYTTPKGVAVEGLTNNNLRYYKTEFLPREMSFDAKQALMRASVDLLCIKENIYTEVREFCGMKFKPSLLRYFNDNGRQMLLIFDERVIEHIVPMIANVEGKLKVYVFSNGAYAYEDEFQEVRDKVEVCALPEAILQAYHKVLPHREEEVRI